MIEKETGDVLCKDGSRLQRSMTRAQFLSSRSGARPTVFVQNEPYCCYKIEAELQGGWCFLVLLWFQGEKLQRTSLCALDDRFAVPVGQEWSEVMERAEQARRTWHDHWLGEQLSMALPARFAWGMVSSVYDPQSMSSLIHLQYNDESP